MNILQNWLSVGSKCSIILLSFAIFSSLTQCLPSKSSNQDIMQEKNKNPTEKTVIIRGIYKMEIPEGYSIDKNIGDDTEFLQVRNEKGDVLIAYEAGVEDMVFEPNDANTLKSKYEQLEELTKLPDANIWMAYKTTTASFRNIDARVYAAQGHEFTELLRISCSDTKLVNVKEILKTIQRN